MRKLKAITQIAYHYAGNLTVQQPRKQRSHSPLYPQYFIRHASEIRSFSMSHEPKPSRPIIYFYPGDGLCPKSSHLQNGRLQSYASWTSLSKQSLEKPHSTHRFLDLLDQIPSFLAPVLSQSSLTNLKFSLSYNEKQHTYE